MEPRVACAAPHRSNDGALLSLNERDSLMEATIRLLRVGQILTSAFRRSYRASSLDRSAVRLFPLDAKPAVREGSQRKRVLRRDGYRCRGCDKKGDGIAVTVHHIRPDVSHIEEMLTLCTGCQALAKGRKLSGVDIPDFLARLWHYLHHPLQAGRESIHANGHGN